MAQRLAKQVQQLMEKESKMFDFRTPDTPPVLLVLDRRTDLITPLLLQWTYQAMLHDFFTIRNSKLCVEEKEEIVLTAGSQDPFFRDNKYSNYGQIGENVKQLVKDLERKTRENSHLDSIPDMKRFVEEYPEYRKLSSNVNKHLSLVERVSKKVEVEHLLDLSELQQILATAPLNYTNHFDLLKGTLGRSDLGKEPKLILALIFALRYYQSPQFNFLLLHEFLDEHSSSLVDFVLKLALTEGSSIRSEVAAPLSQRTMNMLAFSQESVYTQHVPPVVAIVDNLMKGRLSPSLFPPLNNTPSQNLLTEKPQDIIIFFINGSTFAEEFTLQKLAQAVPAVSIVLGGSYIHNTSSLLSEVQRLQTYFSTPNK